MSKSSVTTAFHAFLSYYDGDADVQRFNEELYSDAELFYLDASINDFNVYEDLMYDNIAENAEYEYRNNFGVGYGESILMARDMSPNKTKDAGLVITDKFVYQIIDGRRSQFSWNKICEVVLENYTIVFYTRNRKGRIKADLSCFYNTGLSIGKNKFAKSLRVMFDAMAGNVSAPEVYNNEYEDNEDYYDNSSTNNDCICPRCGSVGNLTKYETGSQYIGKKFMQGAGSEIGGGFGAFIGGIFGIPDVGKELGKKLGKYVSGEVASDMSDDHYKYVCPNCGYEWDCN